MEATQETVRQVKVRRNYDQVAWKWMRYSAILLIPLVGIHIVLQDVIVGVHSMDIGYVAERWANIFWRVYDALLLGFAMAHGMNGLRQVTLDFVKGEPRLQLDRPRRARQCPSQFGHGLGGNDDTNLLARGLRERDLP